MALERAVMDAEQSDSDDDGQDAMRFLPRAGHGHTNADAGMALELALAKEALEHDAEEGVGGSIVDQSQFRNLEVSFACHGMR